MLLCKQQLTGLALQQGIAVHDVNKTVIVWARAYFPTCMYQNKFCHHTFSNISFESDKQMQKSYRFKPVRANCPCT